MSHGECLNGGWVGSLRGQIITFTGRVALDERHSPRRYCAKRAEGCGAIVRPEYSRDVTLVVRGDLTSQVVIDPVAGRSEKLCAVDAARGHGRHVHVVDASGFAALLDHRRAPCR